MTATPRTDAGHPAWCDRRPAHCHGKHHQSAGAVVPGDEYAGITIRAALRGSDHRQFVELAFAPAGAVSPDFDPPADPELVTDPHAHDLAIEQAVTLRRELGRLLAMITR